MNYLKLELGKPIIVALKYPTGKPVKGFHGPELRWILTNDQALYTPVQVQEQIAGLKIKAGQRFQIERGKNGWKVSHPQPQPAAAILDADVRAMAISVLIGMQQRAA